MSAVFESLCQQAAFDPARTALIGVDGTMSYGELDNAVWTAGRSLGGLGIGVLGLFADNGLPWALADLAALAADIPLVPLPLFFSPGQIVHALRNAGADALLTDRPEYVARLLTEAGIRFDLAGRRCDLHLVRLHGLDAVSLPRGTAKITYTSGTTGTPKGVCLSLAQIEAVAVSLREASGAQASDRHLCVTPLSTLLENVGGLYTTILAGASACLVPLAEVGLQGASALDPARLSQALREHAATTAILAPQMLLALVAMVEAGMPSPSGLRFVAVGGAPVSPRLLLRARRLGIPAFEGYGLSECASVVALNTPGADRAGSVGRPLPHVEVSISAEGEVLVRGAGFLGYLGGDGPRDPWPTGDLGYLDAEGFLHLTGRRRSVFITTFGRNVAPEWVERELALQPAIAQAAVFGEARPFNVAVIAMRPGASAHHIDAAVRLANLGLPDYARVGAWLGAAAPFSPANRQMTENGRPRREAIFAAYAGAIETLYQENTNVLL